MSKSTNITISVGRREAAVWGALAVCLVVIAFQFWPSGQNVPTDAEPVIETSTAQPVFIPDHSAAERDELCLAASQAGTNANSMNESVTDTVEMFRQNPQVCKLNMTDEIWRAMVKPYCSTLEPKVARAIVVSKELCGTDIRVGLTMHEDRIRELARLVGRRIESAC